MKNPDEILQDAEEDSWVFDSLVNFLDGPIWKLPVVGFLEEKSVVFDPDSYSNMTGEKETEYRKIHEDYKGLVDYMLGSFMEDIQVTPEQVEDACRIRENAKNSQPESHVTKVSLEQLWAAEDFSSFRKLMTRKNIDLQLQSLELLVAKYGVLSPALRNAGAEGGESNSEEDFLQVVIRYADPSDLFQQGKDSEEMPVQHRAEAPLPIQDNSLEETTTPPDLHHIVSTRNQNQLTKELLAINFNVTRPQLNSLAAATEPAVANSLPKSRNGSQICKLENAEDSSSKTPGQKNLDVSTGITSAQVELNQTAGEALVSGASEQVRLLTSVRRALLEMPEGDDEFLENTTIPVNALPGSEAEIQQRREYMRAQRDKLVAMKRLEREKQLAREDGGPSRPKSAKAAQLAMKSGPGRGSASERSLAARRAIAERLKQELIRK